MPAQWYTLYSKPRKEAQIERYLQSKQIEAYYPALSVKPVNPRAARERGFFPRYLFVQADLDEIGASQLQWIPGAVGLVHFGGEPALVPDAFIQELQRCIVQIERVGGLHLDGLKRGDRVEIVDGPFAGYEAIFDVHLKSDERVQVLMHWLGRDMKIRVNANAVEKRRPR